METYNQFAAVYDAMMGDVDYPARAAYFSSILKRHLPAQGILLDLACGTGSLSEEFAKLGYDVIGVDASPEMLNCAMEKKAAESSVLYLCQAMQELDLYGTIDATVCALDSVNHITDPAQLQQAFHRVALFTNPGGLFVFDANTPYKHTEILADNCFVYESEDCYLVWQNETEGRLTYMDLDLFRLQPDGSYRRSTEQIEEFGYSQEEFSTLLTNAGFTLLAIYEADTFEPPKDDSERLVYVAKKGK